MFFEKMHKTFKDIKFTKKWSINLMSRFLAMREMSLVCILLVSLLEVPVFSEELKTYHSNGKLDRLENFKNGKYDGISKKFSPKGKLLGEWLYRLLRGPKVKLCKRSQTMRTQSSIAGGCQ